MPGARPPPARCGVNPGVGLPLQAGRMYPDRCVSWPLGSGLPTLAEAHMEGYYAIGPALFRPRADDLLRVRGLSLREAGILEGDWLAVHRTTEVRSGQLVVVRYPAASWRRSAPCGRARPASGHCSAVLAWPEAVNETQWASLQATARQGQSLGWLSPARGMSTGASPSTRSTRRRPDSPG